MKFASILGIVFTPILESKTDTSISLVNLDGYEYSINSTTVFQSSPVFIGLIENTTYTFYQRIIDSSAISNALSITTNATSGPPIDILINGTDYTNWTLFNNVVATVGEDNLIWTGDGTYSTAVYNFTNELEVGDVVTLAIDVFETTLDSTEDFGLSSSSIAGVTSYIDCTTIGRKYYSFTVQDVTTYNRIRLIATLSMISGEKLSIDNIALFTGEVDESNDPRLPFVPVEVPINLIDAYDTSDFTLGGSNALVDGNIVFTGNGAYNAAVLDLPTSTVIANQVATVAIDVVATTLNNIAEFGNSSLSISGVTEYYDKARRKTGTSYVNGAGRLIFEPFRQRLTPSYFLKELHFN